MKKIFFILLVLTFLLCAVSCGILGLDTDGGDNAGGDGNNDGTAHVHEYGAVVTEKEATCTKDGEGYHRCTGCGYKETLVFEAAGHKYEFYATVDPTCELEGFTEYKCTVCQNITEDNLVPALGHEYSEGYIYSDTATATNNGYVVGYCAVCENMQTTTVPKTAEILRQAFAGKKISILGDSISTFVNVSNGAAADTTNSTIKGNGTYYHNVHNETLDITLQDTWWQQVIDDLGAELLVNNSWSGSTVIPKGSCVGSYLDRCMQLHDDTGEDAGTNPDIIFIYLGTNDVNVNSAMIGSFEDIDFDNLDELARMDPEELTVAEGYAIMLNNIINAYGDVEIYCMNVLPCSTYDNNAKKTAALSDYNEMLAELADYMGAHYVDLYGDSGITRENLETYLPVYDGDDTANRYHPDNKGMDLITYCVMRVIREVSKYYPTEEEFLAGFEVK